MQDLEFFNAVLKQAATLKAGSCRYSQTSVRHYQTRPSSFALGIPTCWVWGLKVEELCL